MANTNPSTESNKKPRGRAIKSILTDIDKARAIIVKAQAAESNLTDLQAELAAVPADRRERELAAAQAAVNLLTVNDDDTDNQESTIKDSVNAS